MQRGIIIASIQVKLDRNYHNAPDSRLTYSLKAGWTSDEILSGNDIRNLRKWNIHTRPGDGYQYWDNLETGVGILKTIEFKFHKTKTKHLKNDKYLIKLRNTRTSLNYDILKQTNKKHIKY